MRIGSWQRVQIHDIRPERVVLIGHAEFILAGRGRPFHHDAAFVGVVLTIASTGVAYLRAWSAVLAHTARRDFIGPHQAIGYVSEKDIERALNCEFVAAPAVPPVVLMM